MEERQMYVESIRGYPYKTQQGVAEEFCISRATVHNRIKEILEEIKAGRYSDYSIIEDGHIILVNVLVFLDYEKYRKMLKDKNLRKVVPPFRPDEMVALLGWSNRVVREGGEEECLNGQNGPRPGISGYGQYNKRNERYGIGARY